MASGYSLSVEGYEFIVEDGILYEFLSTAKVLLIRWVEMKPLVNGLHHSLGLQMDIN
jgi:hypothetical protein